MNTFKQYFEKLPPEIAEKALKNCHPDVLDEECENLSEALEGGFAWADSPEGFRFWVETYNLYS